MGKICTHVRYGFTPEAGKIQDRVKGVPSLRSTDSLKNNRENAFAQATLTRWLGAIRRFCFAVFLYVPDQGNERDQLGKDARDDATRVHQGNQYAN